MPSYSCGAQSPDGQQNSQPVILSPFDSPKDCRVSWGPSSKAPSNRVPGSEMKGCVRPSETSKHEFLNGPSAARVHSKPSPVLSHSRSKDTPNLASKKQASPDAGTRQSPEKVKNRAISPDRKINDKDVYRGLHVATAAACDEDVDRWVEEVMGHRVRRFLADLSAFDGLGVNALATAAKRTAEQRRNLMDTWDTAQEQRLMAPLERFDGKRDEVEIAENKPVESLERKVGAIASDSSACMRGVSKKSENREGATQLDGLLEVRNYLLER